MKIWKTLMPVATLGATAACVVPMASCSKTYFSTSNFDFKPDEQHDTAEIEYSATDLTKVTALTKEYLGTKSRLAQDIVYNIVASEKSAKTYLEKQKVDNVLESYSISFNASVSDYSLTEKELDLTIGSTEYGKVKGYILNGTISATESRETLTKKAETYKDSGIFKQVRTVSNTSASYSISNAFVCIEPTTSYLYILHHTDLDAKMSQDNEVKTTETITYTGKYEGTEINTTTTSTGGSSSPIHGTSEYKKGCATGTLMYMPTNSMYWLEKVTFKAKA